MPFRFAVAVLALLSRDKLLGVTQQVQINKCHDKEAEARALASSEEPEAREYYSHMANEWAHRAAEIERDYYLLR